MSAVWPVCAGLLLLSIAFSSGNELVYLDSVFHTLKDRNE